MEYLAVVDRRACACPNRTAGETETFFAKRYADTIEFISDTVITHQAELVFTSRHSYFYIHTIQHSFFLKESVTINGC